MPLAMARPWKDPKTGVWHLRQRTPLDLAGRLKGQTVTLPIGEAFAAVRIGAVVQASLRTKDARLAKELHAAADAALRRIWDAQRQGPRTLTTKQATALAGTLYASLTAALEDDPGPPELWARVEELDAAARAGTIETPGLAIGPVDKAASARAWRYGALTDWLLRREGLVVDPDSRDKLMRAVQVARESAATKLRANAAFDFTPDPAAARFPQWAHPDTNTKPAARDHLTAADLFTAWSTFRAGKKALATVKRYAASFRSLSAFVGDRDVNGLSSDDLHDWAEHRRDKEEVNARSVNKNDLVAASSVFKWAMSREGGKRMGANPATGVSLTENAPSNTREKMFRAEEIAAILNAALAVKPDPKNPRSIEGWPRRHRRSCEMGW